MRGNKISNKIALNDQYLKKLDLSREHLLQVMKCVGSNIEVENNLFTSLLAFRKTIFPETDCHWYHSDHLGSSSWITLTNGAAVQHLHYLPWGEDFVNQRSTSFASRYSFSAKEKDTETGYSYFGARYYSSDLSIWLSVDPMAGKYPSLSPYTYCANNPIKLVDPNGREVNPIFDWSGNFLGTDDNGLTGEAIIMKNEDFSQNMSHNEAVAKGTFRSNIPKIISHDILDKIDTKTASFPSRPDWDGYLTLSEANEWYRNGNGEPLFVDLRKIDLSGFRSLGESKVGKQYNFNLLWTSGSIDDRLVYGNLTFIRTTNDGVRAFADKYDFDIKSWSKPCNWLRNIETAIGKSYAGDGIPFIIYFYGTETLKQSLFAH